MAGALSSVPMAAEVVPYFQPILSLQTQTVTGYESLGRRLQGGQAGSLGPFFQNPEISDEIHLAIDRILREKALQRIATAPHTPQLFINLKPSWMMRYYESEAKLPTLQLMAKHGVDPRQIVIEITEQEFSGRLEQLSQVVEQYRELGCRIAIDDVGSGFSNFDRIALLRPDILKIDLRLIRKSTHHEGYRALLQAFSILASQMGASLLVEGVETREEMQLALLVGARFVQGFLFSPAVADFMEPTVFRRMLREELDWFSQGQFKRYEEYAAVERHLNEWFASRVTIATADEADRVIEGLLPRMTDNCVRMYICREDGCQVSSNFVRKEGEAWERDVQFQGSNWVWRPYFIPNILAMNQSGRGNLSQTYFDLDSSRTLQTYSCPIGSGFYIFCDLAT
ncbi:EAL domain-containing protein [Paenibacillus sp. y28]|uniref:EAL domain-containing protein n=1 Tax=Paenibacillus sp. y28 TaxID=3129110 RepID=UPI0030191B8B